MVANCYKCQHHRQRMYVVPNHQYVSVGRWLHGSMLNVEVVAVSGTMKPGPTLQRRPGLLVPSIYRYKRIRNRFR